MIARRVIDTSRTTREFRCDRLLATVPSSSAILHARIKFEERAERLGRIQIVVQPGLELLARRGDSLVSSGVAPGASFAVRQTEQEFLDAIQRPLRLLKSVESEVQLLAVLDGEQQVTDRLSVVSLLEKIPQREEVPFDFAIFSPSTRRCSP